MVTQPGWYVDPGDSGREWYWDGQAHTHWRPTAAAVQALPAKPRGGLGVAAFVLGLVAFLLGLLPVVGLVLGVVAVVLAVLSLRRGGRRGLSVAAIVFGGWGAIGSTLMLIALLTTMGSSSTAAESGGAADPTTVAMAVWIVLACLAAFGGLVAGLVALVRSWRMGAPGRAADAAARTAQHQAELAAAAAARDAQLAADVAARDAQLAAERAAHEEKTAAERAEREARYAEHLERVGAAARAERHGERYLGYEAAIPIAARLFGDQGRERLHDDLARLRFPEQFLHPTALGDIETTGERIRVFEEFVAVGGVAHDTTAGSNAEVDLDEDARSGGRGAITISFSGVVRADGRPHLLTQDDDGGAVENRVIGGRTATVQFWSDAWDVQGQFDLDELPNVRLIVRRYRAHVDSLRDALLANRGKSVPERIKRAREALVRPSDHGGAVLARQGGDPGHGVSPLPAKRHGTSASMEAD